MITNSAEILTLAQSWGTRRWRLLGIAFGIGYLALTLVLFVPAGAALWQRQAQLAEQRAHVRLTRIGRETERLTSARIHTLRELVRRLRRESVPATSVSALLTPLDTAAQQAGLTVTAVTADGTVVQVRQLAWPLHLQAMGRYAQVGAFLDHLEQGPGVMVIDRLELTAPQMTSATVTLQLDLTRYQVMTALEVQ